MVAELEAKVLSTREARQAPGILARAMRDSPIHVAAYGQDAARREASLLRVYRAMIPMQLAKGAEVLGAFTDGRLVGVSAAAPPGACKPAGAENLRMLSAVLRAAGLAGTLRVIRWFHAWGRHDPVAAHWHVGPVGVEPHAQGQGFGSMLIGRFCRRMDSQGAAAYLESERATNVSFYERFGFQVIGQASILGVDNWFMWREPRATA